MRRGWLAGLAGAVVLAGLAVVAVVPRPVARDEAVAIGGPFVLVGDGGRVVTDRDFRGRWMLVYFGYTHCPDVCPTTLGDIASALDKLRPESRALVAPIFITVDPARDTPAIVAEYARAFGPGFHGLGGTETQIADVERVYRVYAARHTLKGGDYAMDHSSVIYVMGPDGKFAGVLDDQLSPETMAARLRALGI